MKTRLLLSATLLALIAAPSQSRAALSPKQVIQDSAEKVRTILKQKNPKGSAAEKSQKAELKKVVDSFLDYQELSRRALGSHWGQRSPEEQLEFAGLLRDLIEESYTQSVRENIDFTLKLEEEEIGGDGGTASVVGVASAKNSKGKTLSEDLTFRLFLKDGVWMVFDVEFGDVSLVRHYRGEFNRKIKKESYPALLQAMHKKLEEIKSGKARLSKKPKL